MSSFEEMIFKQRSLISSITNTIANFKKLGHSKMTYAAAKARIETTKERFEQCRGLDAKLRVIADAKTMEAHPYFADLEFVECEDAYNRVLDYLYERLDEGSPSPDAVPANLNCQNQWPHLKGLHLANRDSASSAPIDVIIGADLFGLLLLDGVRKGAANEPIAQNTVLGWIISGPTGQARRDHPIEVHHVSVDDDLDLNLQRFWEVEEIPHPVRLTPEEQACEEHFVRTHYPNPDGRYVVRLPFRNGPPISIGESRNTAIQSYLRTEARLKREPSNAAEYHAFLQEYADLGHMRRVADHEKPEDPTQIVFIPHHAVFRESSATTRIRVVFNASSRTSNGTSLNNHLLVGPKLQMDLAAIILQWRLFRYVYSADVAKMYRQVRVDPRDCHYQRIFWRPDPAGPLEEYILCTVTYGNASATFLAIRSMIQLAIDHGASFPLAVPVIKRKRYIDDYTFGVDDKMLARQTREQVVALLDKGGFTLRKWASNSPELLDDIDPHDHGLALSREIRKDERLQILGLTWQPECDVFQFKVKQSAAPAETKREILSDIAKLFDPLGWAAPVVVRAKILMQQLWAAKCS
ncbi:uncharacterized protein [Temnothorax nylanderi]|uniref:uncharacterized protein n=1 Tax=Temnothorax nylanderi TaxID=102681 RepID=UPI003A86D065